MPAHLSPTQPEDSDAVHAALEAIYNWNYGSEVEELRSLYAKGLDLQWIAMRDLPWEQRAHYHDLFEGMQLMLPARPGEARGANPIDRLVELPDDLEAWAMDAAAPASE